MMTNDNACPTSHFGPHEPSRNLGTTNSHSNPCRTDGSGDHPCRSPGFADNSREPCLITALWIVK